MNGKFCERLNNPHTRLLYKIQYEMLEDSMTHRLIGPAVVCGLAILLSAHLLIWALR